MDRATLRIEQADVLEWVKQYKGEPFHALLCDPPYELGFMGKRWDSSGIAFRSETWASFKDILYPGAIGMAFSSSRTWHRMAVAIEDAGFVIHPSIFLWTYASGFPKATRIDSQVDKEAGVEQAVVGEDRKFGKSTTEDGSFIYGDYHPVFPIKRAVTPLAIAWEGHRYGLQVLKPAAEPIIVFQKPYKGKPLRNITESGAGAFNIRGAAIGDRVVSTSGRSDAKHEDSQSLGTNWSGVVDESERVGLWPANFATVHHPDCGNRCVEGCPVRELGENAEFFFSADWMEEKLEQVCLYTPKTSQRERDAGLDDFDSQLKRNALTTHNGTGDFRGVDRKPLAEVKNYHPTVKPIKLAKWLSTLLLPPDAYAPRRLFNPFCGSGSELIGGMLAGWEEVVGVEMNPEYVSIAKARASWWQKVGTQLHSTNIEKILSFANIASPKEDSFEDLPLFRR